MPARQSAPRPGTWEEARHWARVQAWSPGAVIGADNANAAGGSLQARYDTVYAQCMAAKGNRVGGPPPGAGPVYPYPPTDYDYHDSTW